MKKEEDIYCCTIDEKANSNSPKAAIDSSDTNKNKGEWKVYTSSILSFIFLLSGLLLEYIIKASFFNDWVRISWYLIAYLPVALPVIKESFVAFSKGSIFNEFFLMSVATIGAFAIGQYPEGVAVMLFYAVGELFQAAAVKKAKDNISALLDVRPKIATVFRNREFTEVHPETVTIGEKIQVKVGEKIPLDGKLLSAKASLDTAALTGESKPHSLRTNDMVLAGSINLGSVIEIESEKLYDDSSIAKIIHLVQNATAKKAKTELLIRRLAKIYTPIVVYLAIAILVIPYFFTDNYIFSDWLYRSLIFLVISCPCALVISIPLGYFGGLGAASKNGILFKGAMYMDILTKVNTLVLDKTGTVTKGTFSIKNIAININLDEAAFMDLLLTIESSSTHPIAKAIMAYNENFMPPSISNVKEIAGKGLMGDVSGKTVLAGNKKLLDQYDIIFPNEVDNLVESIVLVAIDGEFAGYVTIADELKEDAKETIAHLKEIGIQEIIMLSGDKDSITQKVAKELGVSWAKGGLLPEEKLNEVEKLKQDSSKTVAFIGDGINDAPVIAASDLGIAMGAMGSDVAIETADMIIQTDEPSKFISAFKISKSTQGIIWQNIYMALGVKIIVLTMGALGIATMWEAVFADVGVALLAILNAVRLQRKQWEL